MWEYCIVQYMDEVRERLESDSMGDQLTGLSWLKDDAEEKYMSFDSAPFVSEYMDILLEMYNRDYSTVTLESDRWKKKTEGTDLEEFVQESILEIFEMESEMGYPEESFGEDTVEVMLDDVLENPEIMEGSAEETQFKIVKNVASREPEIFSGLIEKIFSKLSEVQSQIAQDTVKSILVPILENGTEEIVGENLDVFVEYTHPKYLDMGLPIAAAGIHLYSRKGGEIDDEQLGIYEENVRHLLNCDVRFDIMMPLIDSLAMVDDVERISEETHVKVASACEKEPNYFMYFYTLHLNASVKFEESSEVITILEDVMDGVEKVQLENSNRIIKVSETIESMKK